MNEQSIKSRKKPTVVPLITVILGCSVWLSYNVFQEAKYSLYGKTAVAKITHKKQESRGGGERRSYQVLVLDYSFREASGINREGRDELPLHSPLVKADETVQVEYIPGIGKSTRVKGAKSLLQSLGPPGGLLLLHCAILVFAAVRAAMKPKEEEDLRAAIGSPPFSEKALIYRSTNWIGKPVAVIVDQDSGKIHFQNCHRRKSFLPVKTPFWFSCSLNALRGVHVNRYKGHSSLFIVTQKGSATVCSSGSNFEILKEQLPTLLPQGQQCFNSADPNLGILYTFAMAAGALMSLPVAFTTDVSLGFVALAMMVGGAIGFGIARALVG